MSEGTLLVQSPSDAELADIFSEDTPDYLRQAFLILRGQSGIRPTREHVEALCQNRGELLETLNRSLSLLHTFVKEVEVITGTLGPTRLLVADIQKRYDIEVAQ